MKMRVKDRPTENPNLLTVLERETGLEPATSTLARWHSTTELLPQVVTELRGTSRISRLSLHLCQACFAFVRTRVRTLSALGRRFAPRMGTKRPTAETAARFASRSTEL